MSKLERIVVGHYNEIMNKNVDVSDKRMAICQGCPLLIISDVWGPTCNSNLYLNVQTMETSDIKKDGFAKGCGCRLKAKTKDLESHCPLMRW